MTTKTTMTTTTAQSSSRRAKTGAETEIEKKTMRFSLWTTKARECAVRITSSAGERDVPLESDGEGNFAIDVDGVAHGDRYVFVLDGKEARDPYARYLPDGVDIDAKAMVWRSTYAWKHEAPARSSLRDHVISEIHIGTFSPEGTYAGAMKRLQWLADLGVTAVELMPIHAFPGQRGWGYDGVAHFAPYAPYGTPDDLRALIDHAHGLGLLVFLDVVYNHFGPAGNVLYTYSDAYFTKRETGWGDAPDFDHRPMRDYVIDNVRYWLEDFRFDGLRFDATHAIGDWGKSPDRIEEAPGKPHLLRDIADSVASLTPKRFLIAEDERNDPSLVRELGFDAIWADDFHHQVHVGLTGERDGYYAAFSGSAKDLAETINEGWFYRGAVSPVTGEPRGHDARDLSPECFVYCIQNHDQIGNRAFGHRLKGDDAFEAATALLLFLPMTPLLFMGQEWGATTPFLYFTDHEPELGRLVTEGRRKEFAKFDAFADASQREKIPDPQAAATFESSRLDWSEVAAADHARIVETCRCMLRLRREDAVLSKSGRGGLRADVVAGEPILIVTRSLGDETRALYVRLDGKPLEGAFGDNSALETKVLASGRSFALISFTQAKRATGATKS